MFSNSTSDTWRVGTSHWPAFMLTSESWGWHVGVTTAWGETWDWKFTWETIEEGHNTTKMASGEPARKVVKIGMKTDERDYLSLKKVTEECKGKIPCKILKHNLLAHARELIFCSSRWNLCPHYVGREENLRVATLSNRGHMGDSLGGAQNSKNSIHVTLAPEKRARDFCR